MNGVPLHFAIGRRVNDTTPKPHTQTFADFCEMLRGYAIDRPALDGTESKTEYDEFKKSLPYVSAQFDGERDKEHAKSRSLLWLDVDAVDEVSMRVLKRAVKRSRVAFLYHSTTGHKHPLKGADTHSGRFLFPTNRPMMGAAEIEHCQAVLADFLDIPQSKLDTQVNEAARIMFVPAGGAEFDEGEGDFIDVDELLAMEATVAPAKQSPAVVKASVPQTTPNRTGGDLVRLESAIDALPEDIGLERHVWRDILFAIHYESCGSAAGLELAHKFSREKGGEYKPAEVEAMWKKAHDRDGGVTARTIYHHAIAAGWRDVVVCDDDLADEVRPDYLRNQRGEILATMTNAVSAVSRESECGMRIEYDEFRDETYKRKNGGAPVAWCDEDYTQLRMNLEGAGFKPLTREMTRDAVNYVAKQTRFDSAQEWLKSLEWDGVKRVETFFPRYWNTKDDAYTRAVSRYIWTALAGRVLKPGIKADMVPVAYGPQGARKSTGVAAIAPHRGCFTEIGFGEAPDDIKRKMVGCVIAELSELRGLHTKDMETIKATITRTVDEWIQKYKETPMRYARRCLFIGTTNQREFLADETGNRRWLPLEVRDVDVDGIARDCEQLWAEARDLFLVGGIDYREAEQLAVKEHEAHMMHDAWTDPVAKYLAEEDTPTTFTTADVLQFALGLPPSHQGQAQQNRLAKVLVGLGYEKYQGRIGGIRAWMWRAK